MAAKVAISGMHSAAQSLGAGCWYSVTVNGLPATRVAASDHSVAWVGSSTIGVFGIDQSAASQGLCGNVGCCQ